MEFREKGEEVSGGLTILLVFAISAIVWSTLPGFLSPTSCTLSQDLGARQYAGISR